MKENKFQMLAELKYNFFLFSPAMMANYLYGLLTPSSMTVMMVKCVRRRI